MTDNEKTLTTAEFSRITGISVSTITRMLREKKIRGEKRRGKWAIDQSELPNAAVAANKDHGKSSTGPGPVFSAQPVVEKTYGVDTFVQMTYLTEKGVRQWLKSGRLSGCTDANGDIRVDAANLERPELRHLVRK